MGVMSAPDHSSSALVKVPFYGCCFYTVNTLMFGLGLMDSMLGPMMGTPEDKIDIVTSPICDALFCGFAVCNLVIALFVYPATTKADIKRQQGIFALYCFGFLPVMFMMLQAGMMGVTGIGQYVVMNSIFGAIGIFNYMKL